MTGLGIYRLAFNPNNKNQLAAATSSGLWIRTPRGPATRGRRSTPTPFDKPRVVSDAVWAPGKLWVALFERQRVCVRHGTGGFTEVELPGPRRRTPRPGRIGRRRDRCTHSAKVRGCGGSPAPPRSTSRTCPRCCSVAVKAAPRRRVPGGAACSAARHERTDEQPVALRHGDRRASRPRRPSWSSAARRSRRATPRCSSARSLHHRRARRRSTTTPPTIRNRRLRKARRAPIPRSSAAAYTPTCTV